MMDFDRRRHGKPIVSIVTLCFYSHKGSLLSYSLRLRSWWRPSTKSNRSEDFAGCHHVSRRHRQAPFGAHRGCRFYRGSLSTYLLSLVMDGTDRAEWPTEKTRWSPAIQNALRTVLMSVSIWPLMLFIETCYQGLTRMLKTLKVRAHWRCYSSWILCKSSEKSCLAIYYLHVPAKSETRLQEKKSSCSFSPSIYIYLGCRYCSWWCCRYCILLFLLLNVVDTLVGIRGKSRTDGLVVDR